jgi:hypothetical protein
VATVVNGAKIEFAGYEYAVELSPTEITTCTFERMHEMHENYGLPMKFRATYVTDWWEATDDASTSIATG